MPNLELSAFDTLVPHVAGHLLTREGPVGGGRGTSGSMQPV